MRRLIFVCLFILVFASSAFAVGTVTQTHKDIFGGKCEPGELCVWTLTCTADASAGTIPSTTSTARIDGLLLGVETDPGSTGPTAAYDIVLNDSNSYDKMGGALADRSATATEYARPAVSSIAVPFVPVDGTLTMVVSNTSVNSATVVVKVYYMQSASSNR